MEPACDDALEDGGREGGLLPPVILVLEVEGLTLLSELLLLEGEAAAPERKKENKHHRRAAAPERKKI